jgi:hypothetical protein
MRRRSLLVALAVLAMVVAASVVVLWPRLSSRITRENFDRICGGMSRAEVEDILGPPATIGRDRRDGPDGLRQGLSDGTGQDGLRQHGVWRPGPDADVALGRNWSNVLSQSPHAGPFWASWWSDSFEIHIAIDDSGTVVFKLGYPRRPTWGPLDNLRWRLRRQWHRWFPE